MKRHRAASLIAVLTAACSLALMGCDKRKEPASSPPSAHEAPPGSLQTPATTRGAAETGTEPEPRTVALAGRDPVVTLVDPGAEPRRELRYELEPGAQESLVMSMELDMQTMTPGMPMPEVKMPTIAVHMVLRIKETLPEAETRYEFEILESKVAARPGVANTVVQMTQSTLDAAKGIKGSAIVDTRGLNRDAKVEMPPGMPPQLQQTMSSTMQAMDQMSSPLPAEPVGIGAKWELHQNIQQNGMTVGQVTLFELVELDGDKGKLTAKITQKAAQQTVSMPGADARMKAELLALTSTGSGELSFNLAKMVPSSKLTLNTEYSMSLQMGSQKQTMDSRMVVSTTISSL